MSKISQGFRLAAKKPQSKGGDSFSLKNVKATSTAVLKPGFYAVEITGAESTIRKNNQPMLVITFEARSPQQEGSVRTWIGGWNPEMYVNLCKLAGSTVEEGFPSVSSLVGVTGFAYLAEGEYNGSPTAVVKNLITRDQMEAEGFPIPFETDESEEDEADSSAEADSSDGSEEEEFSDVN
jgi:hypothetical protein